MASGAVLAQYRQLYSRADRALQQWDTLHVRCLCSQELGQPVYVNGPQLCFATPGLIKLACALMQASAVGVVSTCVNIIQRLPV